LYYRCIRPAPSIAFYFSGHGMARRYFGIVRRLQAGVSFLDASSADDNLLTFSTPFTETPCLFVDHISVSF